MQIFTTYVIIAIDIAINEEPMKTIQMTLDENLIKQVDKTVRKLGTTRSAFARNALRHELEKLYVTELELKHIQGYKNKPVRRNEFDIWEDEQVWIRK